MSQEVPQRSWLTTKKSRPRLEEHRAGIRQRLGIGRSGSPALMIRSPLRLGQMPQHDHRRFGQPELRRRQHPAVACDQLAVLGHKAGHRPAKLGHAGGDVRDLIGPLGHGVAGIGLQARERPMLDALRGEAKGHAGFPVAGWAWLPRWTSEVESTLDFTGFRLDSGVQGIHPGIHQTSNCYCVVICGSGVDSDWGGLPRKSL